MTFTIKLRRDSVVDWTANNPVLDFGEPGLEIDTLKLKVGNGISAWADLPYFLNENDVEAMITEAIAEAEFEGTPGPAGDSAYDVAVANGFVGTEGEWLESLVGPPGTDGADGEDGAAGDPGSIGPPGDDIYPLSALGFVAASVSPDVAETISSVGPWVVRVWVPAETAFSKVAVYVTNASTTGSVLNAFALYDDAGNLISQTPNNNDLWSSTGWRIENLPASVAAQPAGRFVRIAFAINGSDPDILYRQSANINVFNGISSGHRRCWLGPSRNSGFPSTINVATEGTTFPYIPLVCLAA